MDLAKFQDPLVTAKGEERAVVALTRLRTVWFNTGSLCNITCNNCYMDSSPTNDKLGYLSLSHVVTYLDEIAVEGYPVEEIAFTGGEPFMNPHFLAMLEDALERTAHGTHTVAVALNYGSQQEIAQAAQAAAREGEITPDAIERHLFTADLPPVDLLIRTSGEVRLSNFLLWQMAYAEMIFVETLWPDFTPEHLKAALSDFAKRERRYGGR